MSRAVQQRGRAIAKLISQAMTSEVRLLLDNLFQRDDDRRQPISVPAHAAQEAVAIDQTHQNP